MTALAIVHSAEPIGAIATRATTDHAIVESWLESLGSARTVANFGTTAARLLGILACHGLTLRTARVEDIRESLRSIAEGMSASTARQYTQRVKSLLGYAHRMGYLAFNAGVAIRPPAAQSSLAKRIATETEIALLIRATRRPRDRMLIQVGYAAGLRVSELVQLTWAEIIERDGGQVQIHVVGKGGKVRQVMLPEIASAALLTYRADAPATAPVFPSRKGGGHLTPRAVNHMLDVAGQAAGINPALSAHWLRHAHASHALQRGATIAEVKETLGHANVATTSAYLHARPENSSGRVLDRGVFLIEAS